MKNEIYLMHKKLNKNQLTTQEWWGFIATQDKDAVKEVVAQSMKAQDRLRKYKDSFRCVTNIRKYVSEFLYTDVHAYEVVRVVSKRCVEIRRLKSIETKKPQVFLPGGFSGHYADNHAQEWAFESDETNGIRKLMLGKKGWGLGRFRMLDKPYEHYDYNF